MQMNDIAMRLICASLAMVSSAILVGCSTTDETNASKSQKVRRGDAAPAPPFVDSMNQLMAMRSYAANELPPKVLFAVPPMAPTSFYRDNNSGSVTVMLMVNELGVVSVNVMMSTHQELSDAVVSAMRQMRCEPMRRDGKPASFRTQQTFEFHAE